MTKNSVLYALAVIVLTGGMAGVALAGDYGMSGAGEPDVSYLSDSEKALGPWSAGEIREPMETGAVPDRSVSSSDLNCCTDSGGPTVESGGLQFRTDIDLGP
jgi:hypothetical protein